MQSIDLNFTERPNQTYLLKLTVSQNEKGIIYKVTSVLFAHNWDIIEAVAEIVEGGLVKDVFIIKSIDSKKLTNEGFSLIKQELHQMFFEKVDVYKYFEKYNKNLDDYKKEFNSLINLFNPSSIDSTVLDIRTYDRPGLLFEISYFLFLEGIDIISVTAKSESKEIRDSFLLRTSDGNKLDEQKCNQLKIKLQEILTLPKKEVVNSELK